MTTYECPTRICSGDRALDVLGTFSVERILLVTDSYFSRSGLAMQVAQRVHGAEVRIFDNVVPDPPASLAAEGAALCAEFRPQLLIALGGGSVMDCAKGIRLAAEQEMTFVAVPTTSGSGSEVTSFSILTHDGVKHPLVDAALRPDVAVLDDSLLQQLPASLIADTGMDLLAHCLEAVAAKGHSGFTDALAFHATRVVLRDLAESHRGNRQVRGALHEAATMAGMAFDNAGLGLCHAMAHVLGGTLHLPHGRLCAMLLPHVMQINAAVELSQYAALAQVCGLGGATERLSLRNLITAIVRLRSAMGMPASLTQAGVTLPDWQPLISAVLADACCQSNPIPVTPAMVEQVLKAVSR